MNGLPSGPVMVPVTVAAEAAWASRLRVSERSVLVAQCMSPPVSWLPSGILENYSQSHSRGKRPNIPSNWLPGEPFHHAGQIVERRNQARAAAQRIARRQDDSPLRRIERAQRRMGQIKRALAVGGLDRARHHQIIRAQRDELLERHEAPIA